MCHPTYQKALQYQITIATHNQARYAEFLLENDLQILLRKTGARLTLAIKLISLHIDPGASFTLLTYGKSFELIKF